MQAKRTICTQKGPNWPASSNPEPSSCEVKALNCTPPHLPVVSLLEEIENKLFS